jgi:hypothetical protein
MKIRLHRSYFTSILQVVKKRLPPVRDRGEPMPEFCSAAADAKFANIQSTFISSSGE